jgi:hypothetical protein
MKIKRLVPIKFSSLRSKLVCSFLFVALLPTLLLTEINRQTTTNALTQNANQALFAAASQTALRLDSFVQTNLDAVRVEAQLPAFSKYLQLAADHSSDHLADHLASSEALEAAAVFRSLARRDPLNVLSYALINLQGVEVFDTEPYNISQSRADADYFQQPLARNASYISPIRIQSRQDGVASLYFSSPGWEWADLGRFGGSLQCDRAATGRQSKPEFSGSAIFCGRAGREPHSHCRW